MDILNDMPLLKAIFEVVPKTSFDYRVSFKVHELRVASFTNHVPVLRLNTTSPVAVLITKEASTASFQVGCLQSYF